MIFNTQIYQGSLDFGTLRRWQNLSNNPSTVPLIANLRWTDLMASLVTGTKSRLSSPGSLAGDGEVLMYRNSITYRYEYGTLGFCCCSVWLLWVLICLYMAVTPRYMERISLGYLSWMVNKLSVGRALVRLEKSGQPSGSESTREWLMKDGKRVIALDEKDLNQVGSNSASLVGK